MRTENITIRDEYITLGQLLKLADCIQSGGEAKHFLTTAKIFVNGDSENRRGKKLVQGDVVEIHGCGRFTITSRSSVN